MKNIRKILKIFFVTLLLSSSSNILLGMFNPNEIHFKVDKEVADITKSSSSKEDLEVQELSEKFSSSIPSPLTTTTPPFSANQILKQKRPHTTTPTAQENKRTDNNKTPVQIFARRLPQFSPLTLNAKQKHALRTISRVGTPITQEKRSETPESQKFFGIMNNALRCSQRSPFLQKMFTPSPLQIDSFPVKEIDLQFRPIYNLPEDYSDSEENDSTETFIFKIETSLKEALQQNNFEFLQILLNRLFNNQKMDKLINVIYSIQEHYAIIKTLNTYFYPPQAAKIIAHIKDVAQNINYQIPNPIIINFEHIEKPSVKNGRVIGGHILNQTNEPFLLKFNTDKNTEMNWTFEFDENSLIQHNPISLGYWNYKKTTIRSKTPPNTKQIKKQNKRSKTNSSFSCSLTPEPTPSLSPQTTTNSIESIKISTFYPEHWNRKEILECICNVHNNYLERKTFVNENGSELLEILDNHQGINIKLSMIKEHKDYHGLDIINTAYPMIIFDYDPQNTNSISDLILQHRDFLEKWFKMICSKNNIQNEQNIENLTSQHFKPYLFNSQQNSLPFLYLNLFGISLKIENLQDLNLDLKDHESVNQMTLIGKKFLKNLAKQLN